MKNRWLWILLGGMIVLSAAFLLINFHVARSKTYAERNITTTSIGDTLPDAMQRRNKISITLDGEEPLTGAVGEALVAEMRKAGLGEVELVQDRKPVYQNPALTVKVGRPGIIWTPFFATCWLSIQAGYASNGDTAFMGETTTFLDNKDGPNLNMYADYKINDYSWGLISRPGYHQILADYVAQAIVAVLKDLYKV